MYNLVRASVSRPVFAAVLSLAIVALGIFSLFSLGIERYPNVDIPYVTITTALPGASAAEIETEITEPIERQVNAVGGIESLSSVSYDGLSQITIQFLLEKDGDTALQETRAQVDLSSPDLPNRAERPVVAKFRTDDVPVVSFTLESATASLRERTEFARRTLLPKLQGLAGVGDIALVGARERRIEIHPDASRLQSSGLSVLTLIQTIQTENMAIPGGAIERGGFRDSVQTVSRAGSVDELSDLILRHSGTEFAGRAVRVADVAEVVDTEAEPDARARVDGAPALLFSVRKQAGANTIAVVESVRARLKEIAPTLPAGYETRIVRDESTFVTAAVGDVRTHLILGAVLAAVVVLLFLRDLRATIIAALAIPVSIVGAFAVMKASGFTLNTITLLALTLSVGIVIDDAILVLENIVRVLRERPVSPIEATLEATKEIGLAVLATTLSLVAVFLPVALIPGIVGRFLRSFGLTMTAAILISLFVAFTLTPMLCSRWLEKGERGKGQGERWKGNASAASTPHDLATHQPPRTFYSRLLAAAVRPGRRWITVLACLLTLLAVVPLGSVANLAFLPQDDQSLFLVNVRAPEGTSPEATEALLERIAAPIRSLPDVSGTVTTVGESGAGNAGAILVRMPQKKDRRHHASQTEIMARVESEILAARFPETDAYVASADSFGSGSTSVVYVLTGSNRANLTEIAQRIASSLREQSDVIYARTTAYSGAPELRATIDRENAARLSVSPSEIAATLRALTAGEKSGRLPNPSGGRPIDIVVRAAPELRASPGELLLFPVSAGAEPIALSQLVRLTGAVGDSERARYGREAEIRVLAQPKSGVTAESVQAKLAEYLAKNPLPTGTRGFVEGDSKEMERTFRGFAIAFGLSLVFMYLILAAQFESWLQPVAILISLPLCVPFALVPIVLTHDSINLFSLLGILVLFGIVKKNAILQVDHANALRAKGMPLEEAVVEASRERLRPILMTTIAFVAGMAPLALSHEAGAETNRSIAVTILGGQTLSLALTLIATPVFYVLLDDLAQRFSRKRRTPSGQAASVALLSLLAVGGFAEGARGESLVEPLTVADAVRIALRNHPELRVSSERIARARLGTRQFRAALFSPQAFVAASATRLSDPNAFGGGSSSGAATTVALPPTAGSLTTVLPGNAGATRGRQTDPTLSPTVDLSITTVQAGLSLPLDLTGSARAGVRAIRLDETLAELENERLRRQVARDVEIAFYEAVRAKRLVSVRDAAAARAAEQSRQADERAKEGLISEFDRLRISTDEKAARQESLAARRAARSAEIALAEAIGQPDTPLSVDDTDTSIDEETPGAIETATLDELAARARIMRPEMRIARLTRERAAAATRFAGRTGEVSGSLSVAGTYNGNQAGFGFGGSVARGTATVSANLIVPLYDGGATRSAVNAAKSEAREAILREEQFASGVRTEIEQAVLALADARERLEIAKLAVADARRAEQIGRVRAQNGVGTRLETLDTLAALAKAESDAVSAALDIKIACARLNHAIGK